MDRSGKSPSRPSNRIVPSENPVQIGKEIVTEITACGFPGREMGYGQDRRKEENRRDKQREVDWRSEAKRGQRTRTGMGDKRSFSADSEATRPHRLIKQAWLLNGESKVLNGVLNGQICGASEGLPIRDISRRDCYG